MKTPAKFYDGLSQYYHLIYSDWDKSIKNQGRMISNIIESNWSGTETILDLTCGIGTQSLGLAPLGFSVTASDLSPSSIKRAEREARKRKLNIQFSVSDMRKSWEYYKRSFDVVISCDNSLPHLLDDANLLIGLRNIYKCTKIGGGCIISLRDYVKENEKESDVLMYGVREAEGSRYIVFQTREYYDKKHYHVKLFFVPDSNRSTCKTHIFKSTYYAVSISRVIELMRKVGFMNIKRIDDAYFQPVIVGSRMQ